MLKTRKRHAYDECIYLSSGRMDVTNKSFLLYSDDVVFISKRMLSAARQKYEAFMAR